MRVDIDRLADIADFVGKTDLQRVPGIVGVLHHFSRFDAGPDHRAGHVGKQRGDDVTARLAEFADDRLGRMVVIVDRRAFTQELRIDADAEIGPGLLARTSFQRRNDDFAHRAGQHRAAEDKHRRMFLVAQDLADLFAGTPDIFHVEAAIRQAGCANTDEQQVGIGNGCGGIGRRTKPSGIDLFLDDRADTIFNDRTLAGIDDVDFGLFRVDPDHFMPFLGETGSRHSPYIAKTENADFHLKTPFQHRE